MSCWINGMVLINPDHISKHAVQPFRCNTVCSPEFKSNFWTPPKYASEGKSLLLQIQSTLRFVSKNQVEVLLKSVKSNVQLQPNQSLLSRINQLELRKTSCKHSNSDFRRSCQIGRFPPILVPRFINMARSHS